MSARPMTPAEPTSMPPVPQAIGVPTLDSVQLTVVQQRLVPASRQPAGLLVVGAPGTGKTTALVEAVAAAVEAGTPLSRQLVLTYSRGMAQQLRARLIRRIGGSQLTPAVTTIHAHCLRLLRRYGDAELIGPELRLLTAPEQDFRVRELLAGFDTSAWPADLQAAATTHAFAAEVRTILARMRQLGMDPADVVSAGVRVGRADWVSVGKFCQNYLDVLDAEQVLDYAELVHRCRLLLTSDQIAARAAAEAEFVWCDEFAECDEAQIGVLQALARAGSRVTAFADPQGAVYRFRGADPQAIGRFGDRFTVAGTLPPVRVDLTTVHRSRPDIVAALAGVVGRLPANGAARGTIARTGPAATQGECPPVGRPTVQVLVFDSPGAEAEHIADLLRRRRQQDGRAWSDMAVILRSGRGALPVLARALVAAGIPIEIAGDEMALAEHPAVRPLLWGLQQVLDAIDDGDPSPDRAAALLRSPLGGLDSLQLRRLGRQLRQAAGPDAGSSVLVAAALAGDELLESVQSPEAEAVRRLNQLLAQVEVNVKSGCSARAALWQLWTGTTWPDRLRAEALGESAGGFQGQVERANRDLDGICALFDLAERCTEFMGERGVRALLEEIASQEIPADTGRESDLRGRGVRVLTAHRAKGQEWRIVVVAGVQEGVWPTLRRRSTMLEPDRLTRDGLAPALTPAEVVADERRLFYLACSRAMEELVVTAVNGSEGEADAPSRFVGELGSAGQPVEQQVIHGRVPRPLTLVGLVAELRRTACDAQADSRLADAAASRLARLADTVTSSGHPLARGADPARWWGLFEITRPEQPLVRDRDAVLLTGSAVESLLDCPRRWFLTQQARAEGPRTASASLGSIIHVLAQHALTENVSPDALSGRLASIWHRIPFDAAWLSASERVVAESALERLSAWQAATGTRDVVGVELPFSAEVSLDAGDERPGERVVVRGTVDRLERDADGRLRIIDFKTGRRVPTRAQAEASDQMGVYQLAASLGAFDGLTGGERRVAGADLVYLREQNGSQPFPKVLSQPSLDDRPHLATDDSRHPTWVHARLAEAAAVVREEKFVARRCTSCQFCPFTIGCPAQRIAPEVVS